MSRGSLWVLLLEEETSETMRSCKSRRSSSAGEPQGAHRTILKELQETRQVLHLLPGHTQTVCEHPVLWGAALCCTGCGSAAMGDLYRVALSCSHRELCPNTSTAMVAGEPTE